MEDKQQLVSRTIEAAGLTLAIEVQPPAPAARLVRLFQHFPDRRAGIDCIVKVSECASALRLVVCDSQGAIVIAESYAGADIEGWFKSRIACAIFRMRGARIIGLHASAFVDSGSAHVVVGPSGVGKTTILTIACEAGACYCSDDNVFIDAISHSILPFPILLSVKVSSNSECPTYKLDHPSVSHTSVARIGSWIFPCYHADGGSALSRLPVSEVVTRILSSCRNTPLLGPQALEHVRALARSTPGYQLRATSRSSASALLAQVLQRSKDTAWRQRQRYTPTADSLKEARVDKAGYTLIDDDAY